MTDTTTPPTPSTKHYVTAALMTKIYCKLSIDKVCSIGVKVCNCVSG